MRIDEDLYFDLKKKYEKAVRVIKEIQWSFDQFGYPACPYCYGISPGPWGKYEFIPGTIDHSDGCEIKEILNG